MPPRYKLRHRGECSGKVKSESSSATTTEQKNKKACSPTPPPKRQRKSARGTKSALETLAALIVEGKNVVFVTGAGLSVASGVRPFRTSSVPTNSHGTSSFAARSNSNTTTSRSSASSSSSTKVNHSLPREGIWNDVIWTTATRKAFRKDPAAWYREFWMPHFLSSHDTNCGVPPRPNAGHWALDELLENHGTTVKQITQNIDGLQSADRHKDQLIEAHGSLKLYKCCPDVGDDSDSQDDSDETDDESDRRVQLGHLTKSRDMLKKHSARTACPYQYVESLNVGQLEPAETRAILESPEQNSAATLTEAPSCPCCGNACMPQALLFDESYHSHLHYRFVEAEQWLDAADCIVFVGTSFAVRLTAVALDHARDYSLPVYNFNLADAVLQSTSRLNVSNVTGPAVHTLPALAEACRLAAANVKDTTTSSKRKSSVSVSLEDAAIVTDAS